MSIATMNTARRLPRILSKDDLRTAAPSIFATEPYHAMSNRYKFVPTVEVIDMLADAGYVPTRAMQSHTRIEGKSDFTAHMVWFLHRDRLVPDHVLGAEIPQLILGNSHDGASTYYFSAGILRLACLNGAVSSAERDSFKIKHMGSGDFHKQVIDATYTVMDGNGATLDQIEAWKQIPLTNDHRDTFARAALELKGNANLSPDQILQAKRTDDMGRDLWTTSQVIQEHLIRGGDVGHTASGRRSRSRPVASVTEDLRINRGLWTMTDHLAKLITNN